MISVITKGGSGKSGNYKEFLMTSASDVSNLPTSVRSSNGVASVGSVAMTEDMEHTYILSPENVWEEV